MVDEVEDQLKRGKRIEVLDFTNFKAPKLSSRVWNLECLETLCIEVHNIRMTERKQLTIYYTRTINSLVYRLVFKI